MFVCLIFAAVWIGLEVVAAEQLAKSERIQEDGAMPYDARLLWRLAKGRHRFGRLDAQIDSDGFRIIPYEGSSEKKVLFLGDSSTFGFDVSAKETFAYKAGRCLHYRPINAGVPGYTSTQSMLQWRDLSRRMRPDLLVVASLWSDLVQTKYPDAILLAQQNTSWWQDGLYHHSNVFRWLYGALREDKNAKRNHIFWQRLMVGEDQRGFSPRVPPQEYAAHLAKMLSLYPNMDRIVLLLPTNHSVPQPKQAREYRQRAKDVAKEYGARILDMDQVQSKYSYSERFLDVVHPSPLGHTEIAEALCGLEKRGG